MVKPSTKEHYVLKVYKHWATYISKHRLGFKSKYYLTKSRKIHKLSFIKYCARKFPLTLVSPYVCEWNPTVRSFTILC